MAISIRNPVAERLAREVAAKTGESMTEAVIHALEERLDRLQGRRTPRDTVREIMSIARRCAALPDRDTRSSDEILGYDDTGTPT